MTRISSFRRGLLLAMVTVIKHRAVLFLIIIFSAQNLALAQQLQHPSRNYNFSEERTPDYKEEVTREKAPTTIAIVGCGPGGLSFLHALNSLRRKMEANDPDDPELMLLPIAKCIERSDRPGGVWKQTDNRDNTNMYDGLWTNGPKEAFEYDDYTFLEHFGDIDLPVYMPRAAILEYILGRVTKHGPDIFQQCEFNTEVQSVTFMDDLQIFEMVSKNLISDEHVTEHFDKVIWAAGFAGKKHMPRPILKALKGFSGNIIHSSDTDLFEEDVRGKNVLFIGASYSTEDLALVAIRLGVNHIHVSSRDEFPFVGSVSYWPYNKVSVHTQVTPVNARGRSIEFSNVDNSAIEHSYKFEISDDVSFTLTDIDTIIFATGYDVSDGMLEPRLRETLKFGYEFALKVPDDWVMEENELTGYLGIIEPKHVHYYDTDQPNLWRGCMSIDFPSFFVLNHSEDFPLMGIEANARLILSFITNRVNHPSSPTEMRRTNEIVALKKFQLPWCRYHMDYDYGCGVYLKFRESDDKFNDLMDASCYQWLEHFVLDMGEILRDVESGLQLGTHDKGFTKQGLRFQKNIIKSDMHRSIKCNDEEKCTKTFRDYVDGHEIKSLFTGRKASKLPIPWLDIHGNGVELILGRPVNIDQYFPNASDIHEDTNRWPGIKVPEGIK